MEEALVVTVSILAHRRCDLVDYGLVNKVAEEGGSSAQETGRASRCAYYISELFSRDTISFSEISIGAYEDV